MKKNILIMAGLILAVNLAHAQEVLQLNDVYNLIQKNNPELNVYDAQIRSLDEASKGARSWAPPEFGAGFFMTPYNLSMIKATPTEKGMGAFMVSASQMFPNKKEQNANEEYLQSLSAVNKEKKQFSLNDLFAKAKKAYYDWLIVEKKISVLDQNEKLLNFMIQSAELRYKNNLGKLNAYYKVKAALGKIENQRETLKNNVKQYQINLNTLMNRDKNENFIVDTNYTLKNYVAVDTNYLIGARSDIKAVEQNLKINQLQLNLEKSKQLAQFGIQYNHMFAFGQRPMQFSLMVMMKIPLAPWSAGRYKASIESLKWKEKEYEEEKQTIVNAASGEVESLLSSINSKKRQVQLFEQNIIPALKKNYQVMQLAYEQNTGELFELFDAWETLNMTQLDYLDQLQELLSLQVEMDKTLEQK
jgi:outer membrane protein TolC